MSLRSSFYGRGKKYELLRDQQIVAGGVTLYRIRALRDCGKVKAGDFGGFVASERNLSHQGNCWIADEAQVFDGAVVSGDAQVFGCSRVYGHGRVEDQGQVLGNAQVFEHGWVFKKGVVFDNAKVFGCAQVRDQGLVFGSAMISDDVRVLECGQVCGDMRIGGETVVDGHEKDRRPAPRKPSRGPPAGGRRPRFPGGRRF